MARPATSRRPTKRRPRGLDRSSQRPVPRDIDTPSAARPSSPRNDIPMSTPSQRPAESPSADLTPQTCWTLLPVAERQQFELRLSRLVLKAARIPSLDTEENA